MSCSTRRCIASLLTAMLLIAAPVTAAGAATEDPSGSAGPSPTALEPIEIEGRPANGDDDGLGVRSSEVSLSEAPQTVELADEPEMVILDDVQPGTDLAIRSRHDGAWSEWTDLHVDDTHAPDGLPGEEGSADDSSGVGPVWLGEGAESLQIQRHAGDDAEVTVEALTVLDTPSVAESGPNGIRALAATTNAPFIRSRASWATAGMGWATDNSGCGSKPSANGDVWAMVVHHTAGRNDYSQADVPAILRGIWRYHVQSRGWCDVGYNFFVDRFGGVWEGRQGGVDKAISGGHTFGHNTETSGVAQLGDFSATTAPSAMTTATAKLIGWKLGVHGLDPQGRSILTNRASTRTPKGLAPGASIEVPSVLGHRDLGSTACPGSSTYARLGNIASSARTGAHVMVLYRTFVGSTPSDGVYAGWLSYAHANGLEATARAMSRTAAYAGPMIDDLYRRVLGRGPDPSGRAYWLDRVANGAGLRNISIGFYASAEHYRDTGNTPEAYVASLYRDILHRQPDDGGAQHWTQRLRRGEALTDIAGGFFGSVESRADRVNRLYQSVLDRSADPTGIRSWSEYLLRHDDLDLAAYLTSSLEYAQKNLH